MVKSPKRAMVLASLRPATTRLLMSTPGLWAPSARGTRRGEVGLGAEQPDRRVHTFGYPKPQHLDQTERAIELADVPLDADNALPLSFAEPIAQEPAHGSRERRSTPDSSVSMA